MKYTPIFVPLLLILALLAVRLLSATAQRGRGTEGGDRLRRHLPLSNFTGRISRSQDRNRERAPALASSLANGPTCGGTGAASLRSR
jgi:hypothetical protein